MEIEKSGAIPKRLRGFGTVVVTGKKLKERFRPEKAKPHWWRNRMTEACWSLFLVGLNFRFAFPFFEYHFKHFFSAPMIPFLARIVSFVSRSPLETTTSTVVLVFYILGPLTLYFFVKEITGRLLPAVWAALLFSSPIFRSKLLEGLFYGDGAHLAALTLIPLVCCLVLRFLKKGSFSSCILASLGIVLVALISPPGLFVCLGFLVIITFSEMLLAHGKLKLVRMMVLLILVAGLSAFWYNPGFVRLLLFSKQGKEILTILFNLFPLLFFLVPVLGTFGFLLFVKKPFLQPLFIALGLTVVFFLVSFSGRLGSSFFVSYPDKYWPELGLSLSFFSGIIMTGIFDFLRTRAKIGRFELEPKMRMKVAVLFLFFVFLPFFILFLKGESYLLALTMPGEGVLGHSTDNGVVGLGGIRGQTGRLAKWFGYLVTGLTVGMVSYLGIKNDKRKKNL